MLISHAFENYSLEMKLQGMSAKTLQNYSSVCHHLIKSCGDVPVEFITYEQVLRWKYTMDYEGKKSSTMSSNLSRLREVFKYLRSHNYIVLDPRDITLPRVVVEEKDYLDHSDVQKMIDNAERPRDKALIAVMWSTGGRISEVLSLNRDSVVDGMAHVIGKGGRLVTLRIDNTAAKYIEEYLATRHDRIPPLFISAQMRRITVSRAEQLINEIAGELNFTRADGYEKRITPHSIRHSFATDLVVNGADLVTTQKLMNHASINSTKRYVHLNQPRENENYARFHSS
jgi:integrase/recombinase XerD